MQFILFVLLFITTTMGISEEVGDHLDISLENEKSLGKDEDMLEEFTNIFFNTIEEHMPIEVTFASSVYSSSMPRVLYEIINENGKEVGVVNPEVTAADVSEAFESIHDNLTPAGMVSIVGRAVAEILHSEYTLTKENVIPLATEYAESTLEALKDSSVESSLHALSYGIKSFLGKRDIYTADKWQILKSHFFKSIYLAVKTEL